MRLDGQVALVTGASRGLGHACALAYAGAGAKVVAIARTVGGLEDLDDAIRAKGGEALLVPLDLADGPGIDRLGPALAERFGRLDILLGAAATIGTQTPIGHMKDAAWSETFDINATANWRLLRTLDPLLRASDGARALFVTCDMGTPAFLSAYAASKAALGALVVSYAKEVRHAGVSANLLDPGPHATRLRTRYLPGEDQSSLLGPDAFAERIVDITETSRGRSGALWHHALAVWNDEADR